VVDDAAWVALRTELRRAYESLLVAVETHGVWDEDALGVAIGAIAHTAYHLGAIRQRLVRAGGPAELPRQDSNQRPVDTPKRERR